MSVAEEALAVPAARLRPASLTRAVAGLWSHAAVRKALLLVLLAVAWELYARRLANPLLVPTALDTARALATSIRDGELVARVRSSLWLLLIGYGAGVTLAIVLTFLAAATRLGADLLDLLTSMLNPLPAVALLPLALLWFGIGPASLVFVLIHAVLWPVALNAHAGFSSVSPTLRMVGRNYGLRGPLLALRILVPAATPHLLSGLKVGWAFAWRTLIAAELVFGVSSGQGGIGWYIFERKSLLDMPAVFAGLITVVLIGLAVEAGVFRPIEARTVGRWGMRAP
ncbi:MAG TPA: ABC transporter permease subunit [Anaeromyxobacteraceae bacterium]|nr:ABC transporter permease subunit [Anaeromyxobacteraceae bacterium]